VDGSGGESSGGGTGGDGEEKGDGTGGRMRRVKWLWIVWI